MARTQDEIVARILEIADRDLFGFRRDPLITSLDYARASDAAIGMLKPETTEQSWTEAGGGAKTDEQLRAEAESYLAFAFGKAEDHRGLSAMRSVDKLGEWAWLLGQDDLADQMHLEENYPMYGVPALYLFAKAFGMPAPEDEALVRMGRGVPCRPDGCDSGCGQ